MTKEPPPEKITKFPQPPRPPEGRKTKPAIPGASPVPGIAVRAASPDVKKQEPSPKSKAPAHPPQSPEQPKAIEGQLMPLDAPPRPADASAPYGYTMDGKPRKRPARRAEGRPMAVDMTSPETRKQVEAFGKLHATHVEMAAILGCGLATIEALMRIGPDGEESEFSRLYRQNQMGMRQSLRRRQIAKALEGDNTMMIWLGKNMLGQVDKLEHEHSGKGGGPIATMDAGTMTPEELQAELERRGLPVNILDE